MYIQFEGRNFFSYEDFQKYRNIKEKPVYLQVYALDELDVNGRLLGRTTCSSVRECEKQSHHHLRKPVKWYMDNEVYTADVPWEARAKSESPLRKFKIFPIYPSKL